MRQRIKDALSAIDAIASYLSGISLEGFLADRKSQSATEREILVIAEALAKLATLEQDTGLPEDSRFERTYPHTHAIRGSFGKSRPTQRFATSKRR